jgi:hypothetical protein
VAATGTAGAAEASAAATEAPRPGVVTLSSTTIPAGTATSGVLGTPPGPAAPPTKGRRRDKGPKKPRRITFRVLLFLVLLGALAYGAWSLIRWYSNSSYYVGLRYNPTLQKQEVVIYQGRPGGVLGIQPKIVPAAGHTGITIDQVPQAALLVQPNVRTNVQESSLAAAESYVHLLKCQANQVAPANAPVFPGVANCPTTAAPPTSSSTTVPGGSTVPGKTTTTVPGATTTAHALRATAASPAGRAA